MERLKNLRKSVLGFVDNRFGLLIHILRTETVGKGDAIV